MITDSSEGIPDREEGVNKTGEEDSAVQDQVTPTYEGASVPASYDVSHFPNSANAEVRDDVSRPVQKADEKGDDVDGESQELENKNDTYPVNFNDSASNVRAQSEITRPRDLTNITVKCSHNPRENILPAEVTSGVPGTTPVSRSKRPKKGIFVSYSPDAGFMERRFVVELVRQLKENNLAEDLWFDKDENNIDSPCWFSQRMESVEKCRAAVLVLSDSYFACPVSVYESKILLERQNSDPLSAKVFPVLFSKMENAEISQQNLAFISSAVDLTSNEQIGKSPAEKTSVVIGAIMEELEKFATVNAPPSPFTAPDNDFTGEYKTKKICQWNSADLQEWLFSLGIKEFYRQTLAEYMVDGFLLMSLTDRDMVTQLGIDSRAVRKKIMQQILATLDREHKQMDNWHLRARAQRAKPDVVYIVYDPEDVRLAQTFKADLKKKGLQVIHHDSAKLGHSREEFLKINGPHIATATYVVVLMTATMIKSPFVFQEVLFADWLGKKLVTALFKNVWKNIRSSLKAVLGQCPAVDFETKMYAESLDVLEHLVKPLRHVPGVVLEQTYLDKMADGLRPLELLANSHNGLRAGYQNEEEPKVFISYQWDMQSKVDEIRSLLQRNGFTCWADIAMSQRGHSSRSLRSSTSYSYSGQMDSASDTLQGHIQRSMRHALVVLCCITPKYLQSDNCVKDLTLAETYNKPILPILLRFTPLESASSQVRRILLRNTYVDLSNERLYKQNIGAVLERVKKLISPR